MTRSSPSTTTQTAPAASASLPGSAPTVIVSATSRVAMSIRLSIPVERCVTQTERPSETTPAG